MYKFLICNHTHVNLLTLEFWYLIYHNDIADKLFNVSEFINVLYVCFLICIKYLFWIHTKIITIHLYASILHPSISLEIDIRSKKSNIWVITCKNEAIVVSCRIVRILWLRSWSFTSTSYMGYLCGSTIHIIFYQSYAI